METKLIRSLTTGFLGVGKMARAIGEGILRSHPGITLYGYDPYLKESPLEGLTLLESSSQLEERCDVIILGIKPQDMEEACSSLEGEKKYISIAAGLSLATLRSYFKRSKTTQIARVMPNIAALVGESVNGFYAEEPELGAITEEIFQCTGLTVRIKREELMHSVTALSGSGPAYVFSFIQSLAEGGVLCGLPYDQALSMAAWTVRGAAEMLLQSEKHPGELRNSVTSPAGTTIYGLRALEEEGFSHTVMEAVHSAWLRSKELGSGE